MGYKVKVIYGRSKLVLFLCCMVFIACNDENVVDPNLISSQLNFPEFFIEKGIDEDSSYISFRGIKMNEDTLLIEGSSWGVIEYGLFIAREDFKQEIFFRMMGECGTVTTRTWMRVTRTSYITTAETDTLWKLGFTNLKDTLTVVKVTIH